MKIAVIGAGAAGLVCARELRRKNIECQIYEQSSRVGGVWVFDPSPEDDPLGLNPSKQVYSSIYDSLRTNLPRDLMAYSDYTFDSKGGGQDDLPRYPGHAQVLNYLENFSRDFELNKCLSLDTKVDSISPHGKDKWLVKTEANDSQLYDGVAICNGHYSKPRVPKITGIDNFQGQVLHSHNYRRPQEFLNKRVVILGAASSGVDIAREINGVASEVFWCGEKFDQTKMTQSNGIHLCPLPDRFEGDRMLFVGSESALEKGIEHIDTFIYCTGYEFEFPFLSNDIVSVNDNWVHPLYLDMLSPHYPNLVFIGLPYLIIPFPLFEMQAKWYAALMCGDMTIPDEEILFEMVAKKEKKLLSGNLSKRHFHQLAEKQFAYIDELARQCGFDKSAEWYRKLAEEAEQQRLAHPENFRELPLENCGPTVISTT